MHTARTCSVYSYCRQSFIIRKPENFMLLACPKSGHEPPPPPPPPPLLVLSVSLLGQISVFAQLCLGCMCICFVVSMCMCSSPKSLNYEKLILAKNTFSPCAYVCVAYVCVWPVSPAWLLLQPALALCLCVGSVRFCSQLSIPCSLLPALSQFPLLYSICAGPQLECVHND